MAEKYCLQRVETKGTWSDHELGIFHIFFYVFQSACQIWPLLVLQFFPIIKNAISLIFSKVILTWGRLVNLLGLAQK